MKSAAQWFAELPAPPDPGLVDQQYRVVTLEQIAAIKAEVAAYYGPDPNVVLAKAEFQRRQLLALCAAIIYSVNKGHIVSEVAAKQIVDWALGGGLYPAGDSQPHLRITPDAKGETGKHMETPPG